MSKTKLIQIRIDSDLVDNAKVVLNDIGLTSTDIFRILLKQVVATGEVPLRLISGQKLQSSLSEDEKDEIAKAINRVDSGKVKTFKNVEEMQKHFASL